MKLGIDDTYLQRNPGDYGKFQIRETTPNPVFEAMNAILQEHEFAKKKWNIETTSSEGNHSPIEFLVFIQDYVREAMTIATREADPESSKKVQDIMRKIANLALTSMVQNGVVKRKEK